MADQAGNFSDRTVRSREVMNAKEAADFLRLPYDNFRRLARGLPPHAVSERRYVYLREDSSSGRGTSVVQPLAP
jgi:hypothetical protein